MVDKLKYTLIGYVAGGLYRLYSSTWRYHVIFDEGATPVDLWAKNPPRTSVLGHWHGDELALIGLSKYSKCLALSSQSKDGTIMAAALKVMGMEVARGSSTRGGARGLVAMLRMIRKRTYYVSFALDGPKGPRHQAKPGIHLFSYKGRLPIYHCIVHCKRKWSFPNTWNQAYLPKPFAKIFVYIYELPHATKENRNQIIEMLNARTAAPRA